jgi:hypothetical protein
VSMTDLPQVNSAVNAARREPMLSNKAQCSDGIAVVCVDGGEGGGRRRQIKHKDATIRRARDHHSRGRGGMATERRPTQHARSAYARRWCGGSASSAAAVEAKPPRGHLLLTGGHTRCHMRKPHHDRPHRRDAIIGSHTMIGHGKRSSTRCHIRKAQRDRPL